MSWITCSIWPKSVVTSKLKSWASLAISASARLIFSSASYLGILSRICGQLAAGVLDLGEVVVVGLLVHLELALVLRQVLLGLLQLQGELGRRLAVAGLQVGLDLGLQAGDVRLVGGHLPADALDQGPVLLQPLAALLELLDRQVVLVLHLGDRVGGPEEVGELVDLRGQAPELAEDHHRTH